MGQFYPPIRIMPVALYMLKYCDAKLMAKSIHNALTTDGDVQARIKPPYNDYAQTLDQEKVFRHVTALDFRRSARFEIDRISGIISAGFTLGENPGDMNSPDHIGGSEGGFSINLAMPKSIEAKLLDAGNPFPSIIDIPVYYGRKIQRISSSQNYTQIYVKPVLPVELPDAYIFKGDD